MHVFFCLSAERTQKKQQWAHISVSNPILQWTEPVLLEEMVLGLYGDTDKMNVEHLVLPEIQGDIKYKEII